MSGSVLSGWASRNDGSLALGFLGENDGFLPNRESPFGEEDESMVDEDMAESIRRDLDAMHEDGSDDVIGLIIGDVGGGGDGTSSTMPGLEASDGSSSTASSESGSGSDVGSDDGSGGGSNGRDARGDIPVQGVVYRCLEDVARFVSNDTFKLMANEKDTLKHASHVNRESLDLFATSVSTNKRVVQEYLFLPDALLYQSLQVSNVPKFEQMTKKVMFEVYLRVACQGGQFQMKTLRRFANAIREVMNSMVEAIGSRRRMSIKTLKTTVKYYLMMYVGNFVGSIALRFCYIWIDFEAINMANMALVDRYRFFQRMVEWATVGSVEMCVMETKCRLTSVRILVYIFMVVEEGELQMQRRHQLFHILSEGARGDELYRLLVESGSLVVEELETYCEVFASGPRVQSILDSIPDEEKCLQLPETWEKYREQRVLIVHFLGQWLVKLASEGEGDDDDDDEDDTGDGDDNGNGNGNGHNGGQNGVNGDGNTNGDQVQPMSVSDPREDFIDGLLERAEAQFGVELLEGDYVDLGDSLYSLLNADNYEVLAQSFCTIVGSTIRS